MMKKILLFTLCALCLFALSGCGSAAPAESTVVPEESTAQSAQSTAAPAESTVQPAESTAAFSQTAPPETTAPVNLPTVKVVEAEKYTREIVDMLDANTVWDYRHEVSYPRIDSHAPGAVALNQKIAEKPKKVIAELTAGQEEWIIYHVSYQSVENNGYIAIEVQYITSWQYSEGGTRADFFYYDVAADREITVEEYAAAFHSTLGVLDAEARTKSSELAFMDDGGSTEAIQFLGIFVYENGEKELFYSATFYITSVISVPFTAEDQPKNPQYIYTWTPGAELPFSVTAFDEVRKITVLPTLIIVETADMGNAKGALRNGESNSGYSATLTAERTGLYNFYFPYLPCEDLQSVTILPAE